MRALLAAILLIICASDSAQAGFRCGTKIIKEGDTLSQLLDKCGNPKYTYWAHEIIDNRGRGYSAKVQNYVYDRGRKKNMIISVRGGKVMKISVD